MLLYIFIIQQGKVTRLTVKFTHIPLSSFAVALCDGDMSCKGKVHDWVEVLSRLASVCERCRHLKFHMYWK